MYEIRTLTSSDIAQIRKLRLAGLLESPAAFGQTADEFEQMPDEELLSWIGPTLDKFVLGAFSADSNLIGLMGVARQARVRVRHKGMIWGVYVLPEFRGQGISKQLLKQLLKQVVTLPDLEQLYLAVAQPQSAAAHLYRSFGFTEFGIEPRALQLNNEFIDETYMYLRLAT